MKVVLHSEPLGGLDPLSPLLSPFSLPPTCLSGLLECNDREKAGKQAVFQRLKTLYIDWIWNVWRVLLRFP